MFQMLKKSQITKYTVGYTWIFNHSYYLFIFTPLVVTGKVSIECIWESEPKEHILTSEVQEVREKPSKIKMHMFLKSMSNYVLLKWSLQPNG